MLIQIDLNDKKFKQSSVFPVKQLTLDSLGHGGSYMWLTPIFSFRLTSEITSFKKHHIFNL